MWPRYQCVRVPGIAKMPTHDSEVPIVSFSGIPTQAENAGTIRMPPPTPSNPESAPAATPMLASRHHSSCSRPAPRSSERAVGNAVRYAVYATSAAVSSIKMCPLPGTASESRDPMTDAGTPNAEVHANTRVRMRPSRRYLNEPDSDEGRIDGSVEPTACNAVAPRARIAGVD